ncbi:MAG: M15 family metallopeptidase [Lachnospiraceae bacterium]|nr:M15 family metallopeptidase [Lachnospiraceae bacterium]
MKNLLSNKILKPLLGLAAFVIICGFLARYLTDSETLADYAKNNPDTAYGTEDGESTNTQNTSLDKDTSHIDETNESFEIDEDKNMSHEQKELTNSSNRVTYKEGFYHEPLTDEVKERITGISYPVSATDAQGLAVPAINLLAEGDSPAISYTDLCYVSVLHYDFNGEVQTGELICNKKIAQDFVEIFYELYLNEYQIEKIRLIDEYNGDDTASMSDNNTSCFNYRVVDGTSSLSKHALGCAIDINPFYNPYIVYGRNEDGSDYISPAGSEIYADRTKNFAYKIDENDLCYKLFKEHGFTWGGDWNSCKDYQHFQKVVE